MLNYAVHAENKSLYNTPPVFAVYALGLVMKWLIDAGRARRRSRAVNERKAGKLYAEIDRTGFYRGTAQKDSRSLMNVTFRLASEELEKQFVKESTAAGLDGLKGHRAVGGMRASIYNAFPEDGRRRAGRLHAGVRANRTDNKGVAVDTLVATAVPCYHRNFARAPPRSYGSSLALFLAEVVQCFVRSSSPLLSSAVVTQVAVFGTTIYLHRTATHTALIAAPGGRVDVPVLAVADDGAVDQGVGGGPPQAPRVHR